MNGFDIYPTFKGKITRYRWVNATRQHKHPLTRSSHWQTTCSTNGFIGKISRFLTNLHLKCDIRIFHLGLNSWNYVKNSSTKGLVEFSTVQLKVVVTTFTRNLKGHAFLVDVFHNLLDGNFENFDRLFYFVNWRKVLNPKDLFKWCCYCCIIRSVKISMGTVAISGYLNLGIDGQNVRNVIAKFIDETHPVFTLCWQLSVADHNFWILHECSYLTFLVWL